MPRTKGQVMPKGDRDTPDRRRANPIAAAPVRIDRFTSAIHAPDRQFEYWRDLMAPLIEISRPDGSVPGYHVSGRAYDLGSLRFGSLRKDALSFQRNVSLIEAYGFDHWFIYIMKRGTLSSHTDRADVEVGPGSIGIASLAYPFSGQVTASHLLTVFLRREEFSDFASKLDAAWHRPLIGPMATLLKEFLLNAENHLATIRLEEISVLLDSLILMVRAAINPTADNITAADLPVTVSRLQMVREYIHDNLGAPGLDADAICRDLGLSRRQLYYLLDRHGGVESYIRQIRLSAACRALSSTNDIRMISTIAYAHGYTNLALFSRHFQVEFGFSPSDARAARIHGHLPKLTTPQSFTEWLMPGREG